MLLPEYGPDLVELDPADPVDPVPEEGISERTIGEPPLHGDVHAGMEQHSPVIRQHRRARLGGQFLGVGPRQQDDDGGPRLPGMQAQLLPIHDLAQHPCGERIDPTVRDLQSEERQLLVALDDSSEDPRRDQPRRRVGVPQRVPVRRRRARGPRVRPWASGPPGRQNDTSASYPPPTQPAKRPVPTGDQALRSPSKIRSREGHRAEIYG